MAHSLLLVRGRLSAGPARLRHVRAPPASSAPLGRERLRPGGLVADDRWTTTNDEALCISGYGCSLLGLAGRGRIPRLEPRERQRSEERARDRCATIPAPTARIYARYPTLHRRQVSMTEFHPVTANALVFAVLGIVIFVVAFAIIDKMTPYALWKEIVEEKNVALAILVGAMSHRHLHHHRRRGALGVPVVRVSCSSSRSSSIAACGLIYELIAGTLASYLLGDSVLQFSTVIGTLPVRDGHRQLALALHRTRAGGALHLNRADGRPGRRLLVVRAVPGVRLHPGLPVPALRAGAGHRHAGGPRDPAADAHPQGPLPSSATSWRTC